MQVAQRIQGVAEHRANRVVSLERQHKELTPVTQRDCDPCRLLSALRARGDVGTSRRPAVHHPPFNKC